MNVKGTFLITDISGYTRFLSTTDIEHANFVVANLFSAMLEKSPIDLKVMEVEGDALFCWLPMEEKPASIGALIHLIQHQFRRFIGVQKWFAEVRGTQCDCKACTNVRGLKIKFVLHYGHAGSYRIANFEKIAGLDVIITHRLMKNSIPEDEYVLVTHTLGSGTGLQEKQEWREGEDSYPIIGKVPYHYQKLRREMIDEIIVPPFVDEIENLTHPI